MNEGIKTFISPRCVFFLMKLSKRCSICNLDPSILDQIHEKYAILKSALKTYAWFSASYPRSNITSNTFDNHFNRGKHFTKEDIPSLTPSNVDIPDEIDVTEPVKVYPIILMESFPQINPLAHITILHIKTLQIIDNLSKDPEKSPELLRFLSEARKQIELIYGMSRTEQTTTRDELRDRLDNVKESRPIPKSSNESDILDELEAELGI